MPPAQAQTHNRALSSDNRVKLPLFFKKAQHHARLTPDLDSSVRIFRAK